MQETRPLVGSVLDNVRLLQRRFLNYCLLIASLALFMGVGAGVAAQWLQGSLNLSPFQVVVLLVSSAWLSIAYMLNRRRRFRLAGSMVVALTLVALALAIYLLPAYTMPLIPFAALPVGLTALLLGRRAIFLSALLSIFAVLGAAVAAQMYPPPSLGLAMPSPTATVSFSVMALSLLLLALTLAPVRGEISGLLGQLRRTEKLRVQAEAQQADAERGRAEALSRLAWQQRHTDMILQQIGDGVIAIEPGGKIKRANATAQALWGDVVGGDILDRSFDEVCGLLSGQSVATQHVAVAPIVDATPGRPDGYTHVLLNRREQARFARLRSELLGLLADEMRNPLTSMVTALEMTLGQNLPDGADRVLVGARRSAQRLLDLVTTLLEINQIEQDPTVLRRAPTPLRPILEAGIAQTAPLAQQGAVTVVVEYSGDSSLQLDADRMRHAFVYLMENALRHSPPYSTVQVRIERQNGAVVVRISDQGPGLTQQQREIMFDQRAMLAERSAPALGLAFSKLVIESHGGRVWVESSGGQGSTYTFSLPIEQ